MDSKEYIRKLAGRLWNKQLKKLDEVNPCLIDKNDYIDEKDSFDSMMVKVERIKLRWSLPEKDLIVKTEKLQNGDHIVCIDENSMVICEEMK